MLYKILITRHTPLYIFGQNSESLSKSPLRRSNRHDLVHNSTYFPSFLELSDSLYRYKLRGMCGCLLVHVLNTYMTSCQQAKHPRQPKNKQEPTEETSSTTASSLSKAFKKMACEHSCLFSNISTPMALLFCIRLRPDLLLGSRFWQV